MSVSLRYALHQGSVLGSLGEAVLLSLKHRVGLGSKSVPPLPGPIVTATVPPRSPELVAAYIRHVGGDPASYRGELPAHLFPQWSFPVASKLLEELPYSPLAVMNGGVKLKMNAPLPANQPLEVSAQLLSIEDKGGRVVLDQKIVSGTREVPNAVEAHLYAVIPLPQKPANGEGQKQPRAPKEHVRVPVTARELQRWKLPKDAGLDFAKLTGDFNPIHWVGSYARAFGFRATILHGFSTLARTIETLQRTRFSGDAHALSEILVRFRQPLALPARVGVYLEDDRIWVGDAPGGPAYLEGQFRTRTTTNGVA